MYADKTQNCIDCNKPFVFTAGEQQFFADKGFTNPPKRCKECRVKRGSSKVRTETPTICSSCGEETTVPFKPTNGRPVFCRTCFKKEQPVHA